MLWGPAHGPRLSWGGSRWADPFLLGCPVRVGLVLLSHVLAQGALPSRGCSQWLELGRVSAGPPQQLGAEGPPNPLAPLPCTTLGWVQHHGLQTLLRGHHGGWLWDTPHRRTISRCTNPAGALGQAGRRRAGAKGQAGGCVYIHVKYKESGASTRPGRGVEPTSQCWVGFTGRGRRVGFWGQERLACLLCGV